MDKKDFNIGVLGGMGTYATIYLFQKYAEIFQAKKEWERPRIIIDNRCTMPSRVRAFLYGEGKDDLIDEMSDSMKHLIDSGCNKIILACNTSHLFLPFIYKKVPLLESRVVNIIDSCADKLKEDKIKRVFLLASEGTIESQIYQKTLRKKKIECVVPRPEKYGLLRECIEAVKQNRYTDNTKKIFLNLFKEYDTYILGCTELPILFEKYSDKLIKKKVYDPLMIGMNKIKEEYDNV